MPKEAKWYVAHTYSGYENKVASTIMATVENRGLQHLIQEVKIPTETVVEIKGDKQKVVERKIYPSYVFIKMIYTDETWHVVCSVRGCNGFVGPDAKPVPLSDEEVIEMGVESKVVDLEYGVGDRVLIIDGPFIDITGVVKEINIDKNEVCVTILMFGRETSVELELNQVQLEKD